MTQYFTPYLSARSQATSGLVNASALQEISGGIGHLVVNVPSRASNAANNIVPLDLISQNVSILSAYILPQTSQAGSATNYDDVLIINASSDGTGTAVMASKSFSAAGASVAAGAPGSFVLASGASASAVSIGSGNVIAVSYTSNGNGIAVVAHTINVAYRRY